MRAVPDHGAWLRELTDSEASRGPLLLLVEGRAGTGKTALVRRLLDPPHRAGPPRVALSFPSAGPPAVTVAEHAPAHGGPRSAAQPPVPRPDPYALLAELIDGPAALLVADDVHRADDEALALLQRLLAHPPARLTAVLTYRPEDLAVPGLPLGRPVGYPPELDVRRLRLEALDAGQVREWATATLGDRRCPAEFTARLYERTGGNAQVVADVLRLLDDGGRRERYTARDVDATPVPVRLTELTLGRLGAVPAGRRAVVEAAAVLGAPATDAELTEVAGLSEPDGHQALLAALDAAVLDECPGPTYGFRVPIAAQAVYETLPGPTRTRMHRRAAGLLARRRPPPFEQLAHHQRAGGDRDAWLKSVEEAAREAALAGRNQTAVRLLEEALADPSVSAGIRARLAPVLAKSASVGLRSDQTVRVLSRVVADPDLPTDVRGAIRLDLALLLGNQLGRSADGRAELERAAEELVDARPWAAARAMSALALPYWPGATLAENLDWLERARALAAATDHPAMKAAVAANHVTVLLSVGDPEGWRLADRLPTDSHDAHTVQHVARGLCNAADAAVWLGEYQRSADLLEKGLELAVRSGQAFAEQTGRGTRLLLDWCTGRWSGLPDRARAFVAEAGEMPWIAADAHLVLGMIALAKGEWSQVNAWLSGAGLAAPEDGSVPLVAGASGARIRLALARQEVDLAAAEADTAWTRLRDKGVWVCAAEVAPRAVEAALAADRPEVAADRTAEFAAGLHGRRAPVADAALDWCHALIAEATGQPERALDHFRRARDAFAALPRPYEAALTGEAAGRCALGAQGSADATGVDDLKAAVRALEELGAVWDAARARATLRAHQPEERRPPGRPSYGEQLSPREEEVAALAGTGLSNREIAATLHLSPRTVEQHVARALRKLGVPSRLDLRREGPRADS
ncbi:LuxR C-terminal-related transcriptional regulator [Streptomyces sp. NPDC055815]